MRKLSNNTKRILIIIAGIAVIAVIVTGIIIAILRSNIPVFDDGSELSAIELSTYGGSVYSWNYEFENTDIAEVADLTSTDDGKDGGRVDLKYIIKGKNPGRTELTFRYGSVFDGKTEETRRYLIEVNEKREVRITERN